MSSLIIRPAHAEPQTARDVLAAVRPILQRRFAVLLGAGASVEAGVPDSVGMTNEIVDAINADGASRRDHEAWALNFVCGALTSHKTSRGGSFRDGLDIEFVASAVALLADRDENEATPFVFSWHPAVDEIDLLRLGSSLETQLARALDGGPRKAGEVIKVIEKVVQAQAGHGAGQVYRKLQATMVRHLCERAQIADPARTKYLVNLVSQARSRPALLIGTLNYDRSIELACASEGIPCSTGIEDWSASRMFPPVSDGVQLLKLHGSVDWCTASAASPAPGHLPANRVMKSPSGDHGKDPLLVFGRREKLRATGPFLDILRAWEVGLTGMEALLIVGYSFRDDHINETIRRWVNDGERRQVVVVDPGWAPDPDHRSFKGQMQTWLSPRTGSLGSRPRPGCLHIVKEKAGRAFEQIFATDKQC